ncbi:MAG TPA: VanW family protein [Candidatus Limiplasma sp.]|nr:VanW family protein [Candidatus Limiplasma sp.]
MFKRALILTVCLAVLATAAFAEETVPADTAATSAATLSPEATEQPTVVEDYVEDDGMSEIVGQADQALPSIEGLTALYTTKIKLLTATGSVASIRVAQDENSQSLGVVAKNEIVTIYKVFPAFVLVEYNGIVGFVKRTCIDENVTTLNPETTPPYGVVKMQYVATTNAHTPIHTAPDNSSETFPIEVGEGCPVAVIEFVDGFAKVLYWRSYGYIDATLLSDLRVVSPTDQPMSDDTPISAFSSFFKYNNGVELNDGRVKNIMRSCELMTRIMQPGEQLDFNAQIGPYKKANGYFPAPVLIDGGSQPGDGGGTCQSSSTLYNTIRQLPGITVLMRRPHGPGCARYLPMHQDAAVGNESLNFIFRNDYDFPIRILAESKGEGVITIQIFRVNE